MGFSRGYGEGKVNDYNYKSFQEHRTTRTVHSLQMKFKNETAVRFSCLGAECKSSRRHALCMAFHADLHISFLAYLK